MTAGNRSGPRDVAFATTSEVEQLEGKLAEWQRGTRAAVGALARDVRQLQDRLGPRAAGRRRRRWETLETSDLYREAMGLGEWVIWLVRTYELHVTFPMCWHRHPGLVEELRGLAEWHRAVYNELAEDPRALTTWHEALGRLQLRALPPVMNRCASRHHDRPDDVRADENKEVATMGAAYVTDVTTRLTECRADRCRFERA
jgi:hypothetical protein